MPGFELLLVQVEVAAHPQPLFPAGHEMGNLAERGGLVTLSLAVNGLNKSKWSFCATKGWESQTEVVEKMWEIRDPFVAQNSAGG